MIELTLTNRQARLLLGAERGKIKMTRYVVEVYYDDGSRELFGDPPFEDAAAATAFGENMKRVRDALRERDNPPSGLMLDYAVAPLNHQVPGLYVTTLTGTDTSSAIVRKGAR